MSPQRGEFATYARSAWPQARVSPSRGQEGFTTLRQVSTSDIDRPGLHPDVRIQQRMRLPHTVLRQGVQLRNLLCSTSYRGGRKHPVSAMSDTVVVT